MSTKIGSDQIQVHYIKPSRHLNDVGVLKTYLSVKEIDRANRFRFDKDRDRYIIGRAFLRKLLGQILNFDPILLDIENDVNGKPFLPDRHHRHLYFNISHSGDYIVYAFSPGSEIGVDIEKIDPSLEHLEIARQYFTNRELDFLMQAKDGHDIPAAFCRIWSRKEALLKAVGTGLLSDLKEIDVLDDSIDLFNMNIRPASTLRSKWTINDLFIHDDYKAAVSYCGDQRQVIDLRINNGIIS